MAAAYAPLGHASLGNDSGQDNISYEPFRQDAHDAAQRPLDTRTAASGLSTPVVRFAPNVNRSRSYVPLGESFRQFWNPAWLSGPAFLIFAVWFMLLNLTVVILFVFSSRTFGIANETYARRYLWTYGPTTILVISAALWMHVEYWCKELTPWARMRKAATPATSSILRDYFTTWPLKTLWQSLKYRDYAVFLSTSGALLLQMGIVVSTTLILLESWPVVRPTSLTVTETFVETPPNITSAALSGNSISRYFGINSRNMSYPRGTSAQVTIENFLPMNIPLDNSTYRATVPGVAATLECESLPAMNETTQTYMPWVSIQAPFFTTNISTPTCNITGVTVGMGLDHGPPQVDILSQFQGWWNNYTCNDGVHNDQYPINPRPEYGYKPVIPGFDDHRIVFITSFLQWTPTQVGNITRQTWVQNFTGIICKPRYGIDNYDVEISPTNARSTEPFKAQLTSGTTRKINGVADIDLAALVKRDSSNSMIIDAALQDDVAVVTTNRGFLRPEDPFFIVMSGDGDTSRLSNQTVLMRRVPEVFSGVMSQAFQEHFVIPASRPIDGTVQVYENRLIIRPVAAGLILAFLSLLTCISILLIFFSPHDCVPSEPNTIAARAKFLAASPGLAHDLRAANALNMQQVQLKLGTRAYRTNVKSQDRGFEIVSDREYTALEQPDRVLPDMHNTWWKPLNNNLWFSGMVILAPLAVIAALEVTQRISDANMGFIDVTNIGSRRVLINLIPAAVLTCVALGFASIHINVCATAPFHALQNAAAHHSHTLSITLLGKISPHVLSLSLKHGLILPCITALCVIIGSFLTIVVSGLYYTQRVPLFQPVLLQRLDAFNLTKQDLSLGDNLASVTTKLLFNENLPFPKWTYKDLVFPTLRVTDASVNNSMSSVTVEVPAIRPTLKCFANEASNITYETIVSYSTEIPTETMYSTSIALPCPANSSVCHGTFSFRSYVDTNSSNYIIGRAWDITQLGCLDQDADQDFVSQRGCPALAFGLGNTTFQPLNESAFTQTKPSLHAFMCYQYLEEVQTRVVLNLPDYTIGLASPPETIESTAKNLTFSSSSYTGPIYTNALKTLMGALDGNTVQVDPFMSAVIVGKNNGSATALLGEQGALRLEARAKELYSTYMVNAINYNFRVSSPLNPQTDNTKQIASEADPAAPYNAVLVQANRQRLKQDFASKLALQVMLGLMTLLAIIVFVMLDRKLTLPVNPASIAGVMILLAGSEMSTRNMIPENSEWDSSSQVWHGWHFSLGWWSDRRGKRFGIDVGNPARVEDELGYQPTNYGSQVELKTTSRPRVIHTEVPSGGLEWNDTDYRSSRYFPHTQDELDSVRQEFGVPPEEIGVATSVPNTNSESRHDQVRPMAAVRSRYHIPRY